MSVAATKLRWCYTCSSPTTTWLPSWLSIENKDYSFSTCGIRYDLVHFLRNINFRTSVWTTWSSHYSVATKQQLYWLSSIGQIVASISLPILKAPDTSDWHQYWWLTPVRPEVFTYLAIGKPVVPHIFIKGSQSLCLKRTCVAHDSFCRWWQTCIPCWKKPVS